MKFLNYIKHINIILSSLIVVLIVIYFINEKVDKYFKDGVVVVDYPVKKLKLNISEVKYLTSQQIGEYMKEASIERGKKYIKKCNMCHFIDKKENYIGPHLVGFLNNLQGDNRRVDYNFSNHFKNSRLFWNKEELFAFLYKPRSYAPHTKMMFSGIDNYLEIADIIAYLEYINTKKQ